MARAAEQRADESLARHAHQHRIAEGGEHVEVGQQRQVVRHRLAEADARIDDDGVARDAGAGAPRPPVARGTHAPRRRRRGRPAGAASSPAVPRMCMRTTGTPAPAHSGSMPAIEAARRHVVHDVGAGVERRGGDGRLGRVDRERHGGRRAGRRRSTGSSRRRSCCVRHGRRAGRVDSPPRSRTAAPAATIAHAVAAARAGSRCRPPSLKESGVAFRTPISTGRSSATGPERVVRTGGRSPRRIRPTRPPQSRRRPGGRSRRCRRRRATRARAAPPPSCAARRGCGAAAAWRARRPRG